MAAGVDNILVKQYGDAIAMQVQLKTSPLAASFFQKPNCEGEESYQDQIAAQTARKMARNEVVVNDDPTYDHRKIIPTYYYVAPLVDQMDKVQMAKDPTSAVVQSNAAALARAKEDEAGIALHATAHAGKAGTTSCSLSGSSLIAAGGTGLTMTKIRSAKKVLDENEVEQEDRYFAISAEQVEDLLAVTEVTSIDYATVKALASGQIGTLCGFKFIQTERLPVDAASARKCAAFHKNGMVLGTWMNLKTSIDILPGQHFSAQIYAGQSYGAARLEEKRVVQVLCAE